MDHMPASILLSLATKTELKKLAPNTLMCMQGKHSANLYFIKKGMVKLLRNVDFLHHPDDMIDLHNYKDTLKDPTDLQRESGLVSQIQLEVMELSA